MLTPWPREMLAWKCSSITLPVEKLLPDYLYQTFLKIYKKVKWHILAIKETFVFVSLFILSANRMGDFRAPAHLMFFTHTVMVLCPSTVKHVKIIADHSTKLIYLSCLIFLVMMLIYRNVNESFYFFIKEAIHTFSLWRKFLQRKQWD